VADAPRGAPDGELVRRFLAGDAGAATELITRHERRVYAVCLRVLGNPDDAADAAQDALLAMIRKLDGFRGEAAFTTWLYRVAMNVCYDHLRRAKRLCSLNDPFLYQQAFAFLPTTTDVHEVNPRDGMDRVGQRVGKPRVVGEEKQAGGR